MSKEATVQQQQRVISKPSMRWVVDTPMQSLRLSLVPASELMDVTSARSVVTSLTTVVSHGVTTVLAVFDRRGQFAVKSHVDFALRLDRLRRALVAVGSRLTVWNLHASNSSSDSKETTAQNVDVWNARGLMLCFDHVRDIAQ